MPFTVSHAIVAVPFVRTALPAGAVAAGAMAPDLPLFLPVGFDYGSTHELPWFPLTGLVLAFVAFALWRVVVRPVAREVLPRALAERLPSEWSGTAADGWRSLGTTAAGIALLVAALAIGVLTHVVWDGFTHAGRWGGVLLPALDERLAGLPLAVWLHYVSSLLGLVAVTAWLTVWLIRRRPFARPGDARRASAVFFWSVVAAGTAAGGAVALATTSHRAGASGAFDLALGVVETAGGWLAAATVLAAATLHLTRTLFSGGAAR
ncbi:DUF4184 family protein [Herbiconiux sp. CPCC 205763]|uniref:DUF4184 family protein n=1 Tax=Herbiconiux aconitum TaxID=2970913 RepID=A0ABT2GR41_9MICO|nr:DUF4184 family protein [Herbiconiux aconitum]MCS5718679.1 DUF4184 family protein [Herbiconiux aconitum]